ncbi:MAG TPA: LysR family transcriptional regulator [Aliiroseovarius sp.]|nr:LysR family transcriptional regulator [Aliiroseovarius sp.]
MYLEFRHLRTIRAIHQAGGLARAAELLNITQSALSHQVKGLEEQVGMELFQRRSKPMKLSPAGERLLRLAETVLPEVAAVEEEFLALKSGRSGRLHLAMECHACFDWLLPVLDTLRRSWPDVDLDIRLRLAFDAMEALRREEVDFVISSDPVDLPGISFQPLFDYEPRFVAAAGHRAAARKFVTAADFADEVLITYPVARAKIDAFSQVLSPAGVEPRAVRQVEMTEIILMLVASGRGVAVLPDWVLREARSSGDFITRPIGRTGLTRRMYAAIREEDAMKPYIAHMIRLARQEAVKLQGE